MKEGERRYIYLYERKRVEIKVSWIKYNEEREYHKI